MVGFAPQGVPTTLRLHPPVSPPIAELGSVSLIAWHSAHLMEDVPMLALINANPGLFAGLGLYIATAAVILASSSPGAHEEETLDRRAA
jgi:hypothetical protein